MSGDEAYRIQVSLLHLLLDVTISSHRDLSDNCFLFTSTLADTMRSVDMSRSLDSLISYPRFPYHMFSYLYEYGLLTRLRLLIYSMFLLLCCRLVSGYLFFSVSLLVFVDSSMLTITAYTYPLCFVDSSGDSLFLDSDSSMTHFPS